MINSHPGDNINLPILLSEGVFIILQLDIWNSIFSIINIIIVALIFIVPLVIIVILVRKLFKYLDAKTEYYNNYNNKINDNLQDRQD